MNIMQQWKRHNYANALANAQAARAPYRIAQLEGDNAALRAQVEAQARRIGELQELLQAVRIDKQMYYELYTDKCKQEAQR